MSVKAFAGPGFSRSMTSVPGLDAPAAPVASESDSASDDPARA
jgi:hypothetical protein